MTITESFAVNFACSFIALLHFCTEVVLGQRLYHNILKIHQAVGVVAL